MNINGVVRGNLYSPEKKLTYSFQYNPNIIQDSRDVNYVSNDAPGITFPKSQYISGGERELSFDLLINTSQYADNIMAERGTMNDMAVLQKMRLPDNPFNKKSNKFQAPPDLLFNWGSQVLDVSIRKLNFIHQEFNQALVPTSTRVEVVLHVEGGNWYEENKIDQYASSSGSKIPTTQPAVHLRVKLGE